MDELDRHILIKCMKGKRKMQTFVFGLQNYFDNLEDCYRVCNKLKKDLGTRMDFRSVSEMEGEDSNAGRSKRDPLSDDAENEEKVEGEDDEADGADADDGKKGKKSKKKRGKKIKVKKVKKTNNYVDDPVFIFGGDKVDKLISYFVAKEIVPEDEIKL